MQSVFIRLFFLLILFSGGAQAEKSIDLLQQFLKNTRSMQAHFQQKLFDPRGALLQQSVGTFSLKRPGRFLWDYVLPYPQKIISNGSKIWMYDTELEQVTIKPYQKMISGTPVLLLESNTDLEKDFQIVDLGLDQGQHWLSLLPKTEDKAFKEIIVGMSEQGLQTMKLIDGFEQTTVIEFERLVLNPSLDDSLFEFSIPPGVDVVGER